MHRKLIPLFLAMGFLVISSRATHAALGQPAGISLPAVGKTAVLPGKLPGKTAKVFYKFQATKGQKLEVQVVSQASLVVMVHFPDGTQDGAPGGIETVVPKTGVCRIEIYSRHQESKGDFTLRVRKLS